MKKHGIEHYQMLFNSMLSGFAHCEIIFDEAGKPVDFVYLEVNPSFEWLTGLQQVVGRRATELVPNIRNTNPELFETYARVSDTGNPEKIEIYLSPFKLWFVVSVYSAERGFFTAAFDNITDRKNVEEKDRTKRLFFESMDQINQSMQGATDPEQILTNVLSKVLSIFDCDRAWLLYPCDPEAPSYRIPMEVTKPEYAGAKALNIDVPMDSPDMVQAMREVLASQKPVIYTVGTENPVDKSTTGRFGVQSQMLIAVHPKLDKPWIFGMHQCSYPRVWTADEQELFQEISRRLADGLTSLLAYRNLQESEKNLSRSLNELSNLMDAIPDVVYVLDTERNIVKWNRMAETASGYSAEELSHKLIFELLPDRDRPLVIGMVNDAYVKGYTEVRSHLVKKDGTTIPYRWSAAPLRDAKGNDIGIIGTGWNLSKQVIAEEKMKLYQLQQRVCLDNIPDLVWMKNAAGEYLEVNEAFLSRAGKRREDIIGKTDHDVWPEEYADKYMADDKIVMQGRMQKRIEEGMPDSKGNVILVETIKTPTYNEVGELLGTTGVARDIAPKICP